MSATHEQLLWAGVARQAEDAAGDTWTKAKDGLWELYDPELGKHIYLTSYQLHHVWSPVQLLTPSPRAELRDRLNARLRRQDPGKPINWKGL